MKRQQLEMRFESAAAFRPGSRRGRRQTRARWWFTQMRQAVDNVEGWDVELVEPSKPAGISTGQKPETN